MNNNITFSLVFFAITTLIFLMPNAIILDHFPT
jgi:hypothetical protein